MRKVIVRTIVITLWIALIFGALYFPNLKIVKGEQQSINVFSWGDIIEPSIISAFEKETGIKVKLSYYASNEELIVKMKATRGEGYDLIIPSDYAVKLLIDDELLKPIKKHKLTFWKDINPNLLGHEFDPDNTYSLPMEWEIYGFGIDKDFFRNNPPQKSWNILFDKDIINYKVSMTNDPIEAIAFAGFYLYGSTNQLDPMQATEVKNLLIEQNSWVEAYASFRGDYFLATRNCPVVVASSSYIWKTMRQFPFVSFIVPEEGTFITIENIAIPSGSKKDKLTYQFINYLFRHESVRTHFETFGFFPSTLQSLSDLDIDPIAHDLIHATGEDFKKFYFFEELMPQKDIHDTWVEVKSQG